MTPDLPPFETVRAEVNRTTDEIAAALPTTEPITPLGEDIIGCGGTGVPEPGNGVSYSNHLVVVQAADFDGADFIADLPIRLGDDYVVRESGVETANPSVQLRVPGTAVSLIDVSAGELDGEKYVEIYAYGICSAEPATPLP